MPRTGAAILSIGDELLAGRTVDTNAALAARALRESGWPVRAMETAGDDVEAIAAAIGRLAPRAALVLVGGGLGPTADDCTRDGVALAFGVPLEPSAEAEASVRAWFERSGRTMNESNRVQALLPRGAAMLPNARGTAPGIWMERDGGIVAVLPGVPHEFEAMLRDVVLPRLEGHPARGAAPLIRRVVVCGLPESDVGARIRDLMARGRDPSVGSYPAMGEIQLVLETAGGPGAAERLERDVAEIRARLGAHVLSAEGETLAAAVARMLLERGLGIAVAESLTGGRLSDLLIGNPGISAVFRAGLVTYGNEEKQSLLGVRAETLKEHGAVSEACAREMAEGVRRRIGTALGVSTTGIAGPGGAVPGKPVGTVYVAVASDAGTTVRRASFGGDRAQIRERSAILALDLLRRTLIGTPAA